jgi:hypothetical protein
MGNIFSLSNRCDYWYLRTGGTLDTWDAGEDASGDMGGFAPRLLLSHFFLTSRTAWSSV